MRVMGVDPGLTRCGVGVVDGLPGRPCRMVAVDVITTPPDDDIAHRLLHIDQQITRHLHHHQPDAVAVERVFSQHNVASVIGTAQASAAAILVAARNDLPVYTYTPSEAKAAITGSGTADKKQMTAMVTRLLKLSTAPKPADAADALAIAICHVWRGGTRARFQNAARHRRPVKGAST